MLIKKFKALKPLIIVLTLLLASCQKDEIDTTSSFDENIGIETSTLTKDQIGLEVAKNLAKNLSNKDLRKFIKEKSLEAFDGDYNFLIETSKNENITNQKSDKQVIFSNFLSEGDINDSSKKNSTTSQLMNAIKTKYPLLQIALPEFGNHHTTEWDIDTFIPLVAYLPIHIKNDVIPAYDAEGNYHELSATTPPDNLVIVIKENERVIVINTKEKEKELAKYKLSDCPILAEAFHQDDQNTFYFNTDLQNQSSLCSGGGGNGGGGSNNRCDRDRKSGKDRLNKLKFNSMPSFREVAEWHDGAVELELTVFFGRANGTVSKVTKRFNGKRHQFKNCGVFNCNPDWFGLNNTEIITWDKNIYGDAMKYVWMEKDGGGKVTLEFKFSAKIGKVGFEFKPKLEIRFEDDNIGESIVEYCDNTDGDGYTYNTGLMRFQVKQ